LFPSRVDLKSAGWTLHSRVFDVLGFGARRAQRIKWNWKVSFFCIIILAF